MIYNHYDSYPDGLGREFVDWIKSKTDDELKQAWKNIKLGRCDNYGREKFQETWKKPQTWDRVTQDEIDEWYAIEYAYTYDIDNHTLITAGDDSKGLQDLEDEIQEDRQARAWLTHKDTTDRYDYKGKILKITRTANSTTIEYDGKKWTEEKYMTATEAIELLTNG